MFAMIIAVLLIILNVISFKPDIDPVREYSMTPESFDLNYREEHIITTDSARINTWHIQGSADKKRNITIVIAGSDAGNMGYTLPYAFHLSRIGFDIVTFDYRGFGGSSDFDHNPHYLYHPEYITDFIAVQEWVRNDLKSEKSGVLAFSMGTLIASAGYQRSNYDFLIAEGYVTSPDKVVQRIKTLKGKEVSLPTGQKLELPDLIDLMDIPMVVYASLQDSITTISDSKEVTEGRDGRRLVTYDGPHLRGMLTLGIEEYITQISIMADQL